jgi:hypothetical protein
VEKARIEPVVAALEVKVPAPVAPAVVTPPAANAAKQKRGKKHPPRPAAVFSSSKPRAPASTVKPEDGFLPASVSPAALVSALASCALPDIAEAAMKDFAARDPEVLDTHTVHSELLHLVGLVETGVLPREQLADLLHSLKGMAGVPTMEELMREYDANPRAPASHDATATDLPALPPLTGRHSRLSSPPVSYPSLLRLQTDPALAKHYDATWRQWERTGEQARQLCREVDALERDLRLQKAAERASRQRVEAAQDELEQSLMGDLADGEEAFPMAEEDGDDQEEV